MAFSYLDPGDTLKKIKHPKSLFRHNEEKRSKKMLSTRIRGQIMPTRNKPQKINERATTSQYKQTAKLMNICSVNPLEKKFIGTSSILARGKRFMLPTDPLFTNCIFHVLKLEQQ